MVPLYRGDNDVRGDSCRIAALKADFTKVSASTSTSLKPSPNRTSLSLNASLACLRVSAMRPNRAQPYLVARYTTGMPSHQGCDPQHNRPGAVPARSCWTVVVYVSAVCSSDAMRRPIVTRGILDEPPLLTWTQLPGGAPAFCPSQ